MRFIAIFAVLILAGCAARGEPYSAVTPAAPKAKTAQAVIYRTPAFFMDGVSPTLTVDGEKTCRIAVNSFYVLNHKPGKVLLELRGAGPGMGDARTAIRTVDLKAGQRQYIRVSKAGGATALSFIPLVDIAQTAAADKADEKKGGHHFLFKDIAADDAEKALSVPDMREAIDCGDDENG